MVVNTIYTYKMCHGQVDVDGSFHFFLAESTMKSRLFQHYTQRMDKYRDKLFTVPFLFLQMPSVSVVLVLNL